MGDRFVPCPFAFTYRRSISRYTAGRLARSVVARRLLRKLPWVEDTPSASDISTVVFADDLQVVHPVDIIPSSTPSLEARRFMDLVVKEAGRTCRKNSPKRGTRGIWEKPKYPSTGNLSSCFFYSGRFNFLMQLQFLAPVELFFKQSKGYSF